jgi:hypothetical protein
LAEFLANVFEKDGYFVEQFTFFFFFLLHVFARRPDIIFFSDFFLGTFLWNFRERIGKKLGLKYKLVFVTARPMARRSHDAIWSNNYCLVSSNRLSTPVNRQRSIFYFLLVSK